jgi:hypothetical protein
VADPPLEPAHTTPRWVKIFGVVVIVLAVLMVILHLTGNSFGGHAIFDHPPSSSSGTARGVLSW